MASRLQDCKRALRQRVRAQRRVDTGCQARQVPQHRSKAAERQRRLARACITHLPPAAGCADWKSRRKVRVESKMQWVRMCNEAETHAKLGIWGNVACD